jgi:hypothetical protein
MDHIAGNVERHRKDVLIDDDESDRLVRVLLGIRMRTCLPNVAAAEMHHDLVERDSAMFPQPGIFLGIPFESHAEVCLLGTPSIRPGQRHPLWQGEKRGGGGEPVDKPALIEAMEAALERNVPGNSYGFTQPIDLRVQELVASVRSDVGLSLYGDDLAVLVDLA